MSEMSKCSTDIIMFLHHMTATLQLQIHSIREIKIYGNYKKHAQTAKGDSFKAAKTTLSLSRSSYCYIPFLPVNLQGTRGVYIMGGLGGQCNTCSSHSYNSNLPSGPIGPRQIGNYTL